MEENQSRKTRLIMVNYLNAEPFRIGLKKFDNLFNDLDVYQDVPSKCASSFENGNVDIALLPVGALHSLNHYNIATNFGIACNGAVKTVCLFSNQSPANWKTIYLDQHSRTSVLLTKILMEDYFCINPFFESADAESQLLEENDAILLIGDKVFDMQKKFKYSFDLGDIWKKMTGLPFVFAVWVTTQEFSQPLLINDLQEAFEYGVSTIPDWTKNDDLETIDKNLITYYRENIKYRLSEDYYKSVNLFLEKSAKYV